MRADIVATALDLIARADAYVTEYERRAARPDATRQAGYWRHEAQVWRRYADRLRAIAARRGLTVGLLG